MNLRPAEVIDLLQYRIAKAMEEAWQRQAAEKPFHEMTLGELFAAIAKMREENGQ